MLLQNYMYMLLTSNIIFNFIEISYQWHKSNDKFVFLMLSTLHGILLRIVE